MGSNYPSGILEFSVKLWTLPHKIFYLCHCWSIMILLGSFLFLMCVFEHFSISIKLYSFHPNSNLFETIYNYYQAIFFIVFSLLLFNNPPQRPILLLFSKTFIYYLFNLRLYIFFENVSSVSALSIVQFS